MEANVRDASSALSATSILLDFSPTSRIVSKTLKRWYTAASTATKLLLGHLGPLSSLSSSPADLGHHFSDVHPLALRCRRDVGGRSPLESLELSALEGRKVLRVDVHATDLVSHLVHCESRVSGSVENVQKERRDAPSTFLFFLFPLATFLTVFLSAAFHISALGCCVLLISNVR